MIRVREDDGCVALCPEFDIASQGESIEEARANLIEALTLFFETSSLSEIARRLWPSSRVREGTGLLVAPYPCPYGHG